LKNFLIITTINPKTKAINEFQNVLSADWQLILVGDKKSAHIENEENLVFLSVDDQSKLGFETYDKLPFNHYVRKNLGYLYALKSGVNFIYDTDDDNIPYTDWAFEGFENVELDTVRQSKFYNVYERYSKEKVWPRGYPLSKLSAPNAHEIDTIKNDIAVWQGLADKEPDVDAIFRLVFDKQIEFDKNEPIALGKGVYCPFNSQNTLWTREMIPYAYLPSTVSFRFTDILRGYVAQRCFWEHQKVLAFCAANVYQERNYHDLMKDFESEVPCYLYTEKLVKLLDSLQLSKDPSFNLITIYTALAENGICDKAELEILNCWIKDINTYA